MNWGRESSWWKCSIDFFHTNPLIFIWEGVWRYRTSNSSKVVFGCFYFLLGGLKWLNHSWLVGHWYFYRFILVDLRWVLFDFLLNFVLIYLLHRKYLDVSIILLCSYILRDVNIFVEAFLCWCLLLFGIKCCLFSSSSTLCSNLFDLVEMGSEWFDDFEDDWGSLVRLLYDLIKIFRESVSCWFWFCSMTWWAMFFLLICDRDLV